MSGQSEMSDQGEALKVWRPFEGLALGERCALCGKELAVFTPVFEILAGARAGSLVSIMSRSLYRDPRGRAGGEVALLVLLAGLDERAPSLSLLQAGSAGALSAS